WLMISRWPTMTFSTSARSASNAVTNSRTRPSSVIASPLHSIDDVARRHGPRVHYKVQATRQTSNSLTRPASTRQPTRRLLGRRGTTTTVAHPGSGRAHICLDSRHQDGERIDSRGPPAGEHARGSPHPQALTEINRR